MTFQNILLRKNMKSCFDFIKCLHLVNIDVLLKLKFLNGLMVRNVKIIRHLNSKCEFKMCAMEKKEKHLKFQDIHRII